MPVRLGVRVILCADMCVHVCACACVCRLLSERTDVSSGLLLADKKSRKGPINLRFLVLTKRRVKEKERGKEGVGGGTGTVVGEGRLFLS